MQNVSMEYKKVISSPNRTFQARAKITLANGTVLNLDGNDIAGQGSIVVEDSVFDGDNFTLGGAVINELTLKLNNFSRKFDDYDFGGAIVNYVDVGLQLSQGIEWVHKGTFTVDVTETPGSIISLKCLCNMHKLDVPFSEVDISFPCRVDMLADAICGHCGLTMERASFTNGHYIINKRPEDSAIACGEMMSYIGQITGNYVKTNIYGQVVFSWFNMAAFESEDDVFGGYLDDYSTGDDVDGGNFTDYNSGDDINGGTFLNTKAWHHFYSYTNPSIGTDDVVITGIKATAFSDGNSEEVPDSTMLGAKGYLIEISENPLIEKGRSYEVAKMLYDRMVGMQFRPMSLSVKSDPAIESGDLAVVSDRRGNVYRTIIPFVTYTLCGASSISSKVASPIRNSSVQFSQSTKSVVEARNMVKMEKDAREKAIEDMAKILENSSGLYQTNVDIPGGGTIYYFHDKPELETSMIVWKMTAEALAISTDGGQTYPIGITATGTAILDRIYAIGINASYINAGVLSGREINNGNGTFRVTPAGAMTSSSGQIGPFTLNTQGMKSRLLEFFDDSKYPLIWMTKPGDNGDINYGSEGSSRSNYEPDVCVLRNIKNGIATDIYLMARDGTFVGDAGMITITKSSVGTGSRISECELNGTNLSLTTFDSTGWPDKSIKLDVMAGIISHSDNALGKAMFLMHHNGDVMIQSGGTIELNASGKIYANGIKIGGG